MDGMINQAQKTIDKIVPGRSVVNQTPLQDETINSNECHGNLPFRQQ